MKGTLKLKTDNGKLSAEYSSMEKPKWNTSFGDSYEIDLAFFESSFNPLTLSPQAEEYFYNQYGGKSNVLSMKLELSGKELDCFEIKSETRKELSPIQITYDVLHLKPIVELDLDTGEYYIPENPIHAVTRRKPIVTPQINSKTKCPTCGSEVKIGGDGTSQFYIPTVTPNESLSNGSIYYPLWKFFNDEHNLVLLDSDIQEIINQVEKFKNSNNIFI